MHSCAYGATPDDDGYGMQPEDALGSSKIARGKRTEQGKESVMPDSALAKKKSVQGKAASHFWIDALSFLTFLISAFSGLVLMQNPVAAYYSEADMLSRELLLGLTRYEWMHLHNHISLIFVVLVAVHLAMHRRWIARICFRAEHSLRSS